MIVSTLTLRLSVGAFKKESNSQNTTRYLLKFPEYTVVEGLILYENLSFSFLKLIGFSSLCAFSEISTTAAIFSSVLLFHSYPLNLMLYYLAHHAQHF